MGKRARIAAAVVALWCTGARAQDEALLRRVEATLAAGIEPAGAHDALIELGEPGERALWMVFARESASRVVRLRALSVLGSFRTPRSASNFAELIRSAALPPPSQDPLHPARSTVVLRRALDGLRPMLDALSPPLAASELDFALEHPDAHVRKAATALLASLHDGASYRALQQQVRRDRSPMVRATAQKGLDERASRTR